MRVPRVHLIARCNSLKGEYGLHDTLEHLKKILALAAARQAKFGQVHQKKGVVSRHSYSACPDQQKFLITN
jgi:hypothetical protein